MSGLGRRAARAPAGGGGPAAAAAGALATQAGSLGSAIASSISSSSAPDRDDARSFSVSCSSALCRRDLAPKPGSFGGSAVAAIEPAFGLAAITSAVKLARRTRSLSFDGEPRNASSTMEELVPLEEISLVRLLLRLRERSRRLSAVPRRGPRSSESLEERLRLGLRGRRNLW